MDQNSDNLKKRTSMTKENLINLCKKNKLYLTPYLNDVLYLHYQGYQKIENLDEFTGLKCLWLECNALSEISGLEHQKELRCLYLHNNFIRKIENLQHCAQLDTLNLSHNHVRSIENCNSMILPQLNTLSLSHNALSSIEGLEELVECKSLSVLDISHNRIEDVLIVKILSQMPELRVLTLTGNPVINEIPSYRKTMTVECKNLTYLDSRPIFDKDRACAEAWKRGGYEEEKREKSKWDAAQQKKIMDSVRATLRLRQKLQEKNSNSPTSTGDNEQIAVSNPQPNIEELIESVEKSIELYSSDVTPKFENFESIPDSIPIDTNATATHATVNSTNIEILSDTHKNEINSVHDYENSNTNRISTDCSESLIEPSVPDLSLEPKITSRIEISDVESMNMLNICMNSRNKLSPNGQSPTLIGKSKPIIEVLSDSDSIEPPVEESTKLSVNVPSSEKNLQIEEVNISNEFSTDNASKSADGDPDVEQKTITTDNSCHIDEQLNTDDPNNTIIEVNKTTKSSAITFFCENLDDLKGMDSDSNQSGEEI
ncbi:dynein axonemal assembly factor 1 homolog [Sitodiplosis mosellana]|uniref:dynein axonemal assembly factor 1 homolog n=1 Tax=Sitodiplosis mosellana TaxID=263140 RepID=UPI002444C23D|nr:dynein axonemal assembly factor 1 homolog [Sitodiplosis mosellana]